ncbi:MAG: hypothetical protein PHT33_09795 [bacterium]|nr:hypothetical protein [bacterium]
MPIGAELETFRRPTLGTDTKPMAAVNDAITDHVNDELRPYDGDVVMDNLQIP